MKKLKLKEPIYSLKLTKRQAELLSWTCDTMARLIEGQDHSYQDLFEAAWEKRCKEATGKMMDDEWDGGWSNMREDAENTCKYIKKRFWGLDWCTLNGINYSDDGDTIWDIYQVIRHQLWLDRPADQKSDYTVDAFEAHQHGSEPLAKIEKLNCK